MIDIIKFIDKSLFFDKNGSTYVFPVISLSDIRKERKRGM